MEYYTDDKKEGCLYELVWKSLQEYCYMKKQVMWYDFTQYSKIVYRYVSVSIIKIQRDLEGCSSNCLWKRMSHERGQNTSFIFISVNYCNAWILLQWLWNDFWKRENRSNMILGVFLRLRMQMDDEWDAGRSCELVICQFKEITPLLKILLRLCYLGNKTQPLSRAHRSPYDLAIPDFSEFIFHHTHLRALPPLESWPTLSHSSVLGLFSTFFTSLLSLSLPWKSYLPLCYLLPTHTSTLAFIKM